MYLTEKSRGRQRDVDQHDEVELLLEAYVKQVDGIVQEADQLASNMRNTEEIVNIILDANRNSLMLLDLKVPYSLTPTGQALILISIGLYDDFGYWFRGSDSGVTRNESEKLHGRLELRISSRDIHRIRDDYVSLWLRTYQIKKDTKVDVIRAISWRWGKT